MRPRNLVSSITSGTVSSPVGVSGRFVSRVFLPAGLASTSISFEVSTDGTTFVPARSTAGTTYTMTVIPSIAVPIPPEITRGAGYVQIKTGSSETNKDFTLVLEEI